MSTIPNTSDRELDEILETFANTISLGIMGNVPGAEGTPIYTNPETAKQKLLVWRDKEVMEATDKEHALRIKLTDLLLCELARVPHDRMLAGDLTDDDFKRLSEAMGRLNELLPPYPTPINNEKGK